MIDVSIIIVNYNSSGVLANCIESIRKQNAKSRYEIIVVDNCSNESERRSLEGIKTFATVIYNGKNAGFGAANNLGAKAAQGKFLLFLNPDTIAVNNIVDAFVLSALASNETTGVLGCHQRNPDLSANHSFGSFRNHRLGAFLKSEFRQNCIKQLVALLHAKRKNKAAASVETAPNVPAIREVDWINGACLFIKASLYESIGGFDERFFLFSEEVDLQRRLHEAGYRQFLLDTPCLIHLHEDKRAMSAATRLYFYEGYFTYAKKYNSPFAFYVSKLLFLLIVIFGSFIDLVSGRYTIQENILFLKKMGMKKDTVT